jgi:uncharacterized SAM-binding protein YcdF (DUF218 family)
MFFYPSKLVWLVTTPTNLLLLAAFTGLLLAFARRPGLARFGRWVALGALALLFLAGFGPLGTWLARPLDERFAPARLERPPSAIVILGGAIGSSRGVVALNESAERMTEALVLARRFPDVPVIFTGGSARLSTEVPEGMDRSEAESAARFFAPLGLEPPRLVLEDRSRNTRENALEVLPLLPRDPAGPVLLVTAWHMPRAVGAFRQAGIAVVPWPVDYVTTGTAHDWRRLNRAASNGLGLTDLMAKEWVGLVVYRLLGYTDAFFPGPDASR